MLMPGKVKHRKQQRGRMRGKAIRGGSLSFGQFGLQALEPCWLNSRQIEAGRIAIGRYLKRKGKLWIRVFPWKPVTKKPTEVRMGKGKVDVIKPGRMIYELGGVEELAAREAMRRADHKLPMKTRFVSRDSKELR